MLVWLTVLVCLSFSFNHHIFTPRPPDLMSPLSLPFDLPELFPAIELKTRIWSFTTHTCCISACQFKHDLVTYSWIRKVTNGGQARWHVVRQLVSLNFGAVFYMLVLSLLFTGCSTKACQWMQLQRPLLLIGCWVGTACSDEIGMQKKKEKKREIKKYNSGIHIYP